MGGSIWVESKPGKGSTFYFRIIVQTDSTSDSPKSSADDFKTISGKCLLFLDEPGANSTALESILKEWSMELIHAPDTREAIRILNGTHKPDFLMVNDRSRNEGDHSQLMDLRARLNLPLIRFSYPNDQEGSLNKMDSEGIHFLHKPLISSNLLKVLKTALIPPVKNKSVLTGTDDDPNTTRDISILLAEDNTVNQMVVQSMLKKMGCQALIANNGEEAVRELIQEMTDVVLMDIQMPKMNGFEATQIIRANFPKEKQPWIIALTANAMSGDRERCLKAGMDDFISKPVEFKDLLKALNTASERSQDSLRSMKQPQIPSPNRDRIPEKPVSWNRDRLEQFEKEVCPGQPEVVKAVVQEYFQQSIIRMQELEGALEDQDLESIKTVAHSMKGSSGNLGFERMVSISTTIENESQNHEEILKLFKDLESELSKVRGLISEDAYYSGMIG
jgi:CheY-like chemotaxis protein